MVAPKRRTKNKRRTRVKYEKLPKEVSDVVGVVLPPIHEVNILGEARNRPSDTVTGLRAERLQRAFFTSAGLGTAAMIGGRHVRETGDPLAFFGVIGLGGLVGWKTRIGAIRRTTGDIGTAIESHYSTARLDEIKKHQELNELVLDPKNRYAIVDWFYGLKGRKRQPCIIGVRTKRGKTYGFEFGRHRIPLAKARETLKKRLAEEQ